MKRFVLFFFFKTVSVIQIKVKQISKEKQNTSSNVPPEALRTVTLVTSRAMLRRVTLCCWDTQVEHRSHSSNNSRLNNAKGHRNLTHLPDLIKRDTNRQKWDEQNTHGVSIIVIYDPQDDAEELEHVKGVQNLKKQKEKMVRNEIHLCGVNMIFQIHLFEK